MCSIMGCTMLAIIGVMAIGGVLGMIVNNKGKSTSEEK